MEQANDRWGEIDRLHAYALSTLTTVIIVLGMEYYGILYNINISLGTYVKSYINLADFIFGCFV